MLFFAPLKYRAIPMLFSLLKKALSLYTVRHVEFRIRWAATSNR